MEHLLFQPPVAEKDKRLTWTFGLHAYPLSFFSSTSCSRSWKAKKETTMWLTILKKLRAYFRRSTSCKFTSRNLLRKSHSCAQDCTLNIAYDTENWKQLKSLSRSNWLINYGSSILKEHFQWLKRMHQSRQRFTPHFIALKELLQDNAHSGTTLLFKVFRKSSRMFVSVQIRT